MSVSVFAALLVTFGAASSEHSNAARKESPMSASGQSDRPRQPNESASAKAGQILVKFNDGLSAEEIDKINRRLGTTVVNRMMGGKLLLVETPYPSVASQLIEAYASTTGVEYAEPNEEVSIIPPPEEGKAPPDEGDRGKDASSPLIPLPRVE